MHRWFRAFTAAAGVLVAASATLAQATSQAAGQTPPPEAGQRLRAGQGRGVGAGAQAAGPGADRLPIAELQRLFDAYFVLQAQDALQVDDGQFAQFLPRIKFLQDTRRRNEQMRHQAVADLARLIAPGQSVDEAPLREKLRALQDLDGRSAVELRRAYEALDQILDARQQARFRVFEQNMERRKFDLMLRARRADAARGGAGRQP